MNQNFSHRGLSRRGLLSAGLLCSGRKLLGKPAIIGTSAGVAPIAWQPSTLLGFNILWYDFWGYPIDPGQSTVFSALGISYLRSGNVGLTRTCGTSSEDNPSVWNVLTVAPDVADATQLVLTCDTLGYVMTPGTPFVLSVPVSYPMQNGTTLTLPARTMLISSGGTAGVWDRYGAVTSRGTVRIAAGGTLANNGAVTISGTQAFHPSFTLPGGVPRPPFPAMTAAARMWIDAGYWYDYAVASSSAGPMHTAFGDAAMAQWRAGEFAALAAAGLDPARTLIEATGECIDQTGATDSHVLWLNYKPTFQNDYAMVRSYFPRNTITLSVPGYDSPLVWPYIDWWPNDGNTMLAVHAYPPQLSPTYAAASFPLDCTNPAALASWMSWAAAAAQRIGIPKVFFQEMGVQITDSNPGLRLYNMRKAVQAQGWPCCFWGVLQWSQNPSGYSVLVKGEPTPFDAYNLSGPWRPTPGMEQAFAA